MACAGVGVGLALAAALAAVARPGAEKARPAADLPGPDLRPARSTIDRASTDAQVDEQGPVRVEAVVRDLDGQPVPDAVVEVWADGRGCVDRSDGNRQYMRGDVVEAPPGMVVWRSAVEATGPDGVARLQVPVGMMTHVVAFDRSGRRDMLRVERPEIGWDCTAPCGGVGGCGTCTTLPCTFPRQADGCGRDILHLVLRLAPPARVTGRVVDERGRPVAGARIGTLTEMLEFDTDEYAYDELQARDSLLELPYASPPDDWSRIPHATPVATSANGRFAVDLVEWRQFVVAATAPGLRLGVSAPILFLPGRHIDVEIRLRRSSRIDLRVVDASGHPIAGARAGLEEDDLFDDLPARADRRGRILFDGLRPQLQSVSVDAEGYEPFHATVRPSWRPVTVRLVRAPHIAVGVSAPPELLARLGDLPLLEIRFLRPGESLAEPTGSRRSPAAQARYNAMSDVEKLELAKAEFRTARDRYDDLLSRRTTVELGRDGRGRVAMEDLPPGRYTVCVAEPTTGSCGPTVPLGRDAAAVSLRLDADGIIAAD